MLNAGGGVTGRALVPGDEYRRSSCSSRIETILVARPVGDGVQRTPTAYRLVGARAVPPVARRRRFCGVDGVAAARVVLDRAKALGLPMIDSS